MYIINNPESDSSSATDSESNWTCKLVFVFEERG